MEELNHGSVYYPQCAINLRIRLEDFGDKLAKSDNVANEAFNITCLAKRVTVEINDYATADKFTAELDYDNFPFDPRTIRACGVTIAIQDVGSLYNQDGSIKKIEIGEDNVVFIGFADEESLTFDENSRTIKLEGRDYTSLLIDRKFVDGHVSLDERVDNVIEKILKSLDETKNINLDVRGINKNSLPVLSKFYSDKTELSGKKNVKKNDTYWDVIQSIVADAGLICYFEIDKLVLTTPRNLYVKTISKKFVYGQNLKNLEFSRKLGRKKGFNIVVRSLNIESKEVIEAFIPKEATTEWSKESGISNTEVKLPKVKPNITSNSEKVDTNNEEGEPAPYIAFRIPNIASKNQLIEIGQSIYEEMSRQQLEGSFQTKEMAIKFLDKKQSETVFNVLKLRVGTPVAIALSIDDQFAIKNIKSQSGIENYLTGKGYDHRIAKGLSESLTKLGTAFYTKSVTFEMSFNQGFSCKVDFINFIEAKNYA